MTQETIDKLHELEGKLKNAEQHLADISTVMQDRYTFALRNYGEAGVTLYHKYLPKDLAQQYSAAIENRINELKKQIEEL